MNIPRTLRLSAVALLFILSLLFLMTTLATAQTSRAPVETVTTLADSGARSLRHAAAASTITVNSTADVIADDGQCTLREAITAANTDTPSGGSVGECPTGAGNDTINVPAGIYTLALIGNSENGNLTGDLDITATVTINGAGASSTIIQAGTDATNGIDRVLHVLGGDVVINGVTVRFGRTDFGGDFSASAGGGIFVQDLSATLSIIASVIRDNYTEDSGGGIFSRGSATVVDSEISDNLAAIDGGGIQTPNDFTLTNSTVSGNENENSPGNVNSGGGALFFNSTGTAQVIIRNSSIVSNTTSGDSAIQIIASEVDIQNSIIALNNEAQCAITGFGSLAGSNNLVDDDSCVGSIGMVSNLDATLADNGSGRRTHALLAGSNALDAGAGGCPDAVGTPLATDQRGVARPFNTTCDIGAYEFDPCAVQPYLVSDTTTLNDAIDCFNVAPVAGTYTISFTADISLTATTTTIDNATAGIDLLIEGNDFALDGQDSVRGLTIAADTHVAIENLTVRNGNRNNGDGGGIHNGGTLTISNSTLSGNSADSGDGGGIFNGGTLTISNSTISGNSADLSLPAHGGGGIYNSGTLTISNSTLSGNSSDGSVGGGGGGIFNFDGTLTISNSTLSGNSAVSGGGGGGIYNFDGTLTISNSTLSGNSSGSGGGMLNRRTLDITNSIIANSASGGDCVNDGNINTNSNNLIEDSSCNPALSGDPNLGPLQDNGGATETHALLPFSPALEAGDNATCLATDQRGVARPQGGTCDIGAFELFDCTAQPYLVGVEAELNDAIACFNAATVAGTYTISVTDNISLTTATTTISNFTADIALVIEGNGFTIDGQNSVRSGFVIDAFTEVTLSTLSLINGLGDNGGALQNFGQLTIEDSTLRNNASQSVGGAIWTRNTGTTLTLIRSTLNDNTAGGGNGGGAIYAEGDVTLEVHNSTISGNVSNGAGGGGILIIHSDALTMTNSTVVSNTTTGFGGGVAFQNTDSISFVNNIIAGNQSDGAGPECSQGGAAASSNNVYGVSGNAGGCSASATDSVPSGGIETVILPLSDNGGSTATHALPAFSPALEAADNASCPATDQRGVTRPQGATCDIGAYEAEPPICTNPASVSTEAELNAAIACFNAATVAGTYTISFTADITLTMASTTISNTVAGIDLLIAGNDFALDGNNANGGLWIEVDTVVTIDSLTIQNGSRSSGGGIINGGGTLTITNSTIRDSFASGAFLGGGGIFNFSNGTLTINNSIVSGNTASNGGGGGIFNTSSGTLTISNSTISGNSARLYGGGVYSDLNDGLIVGNTFSDNHASDEGGAIYGNRLTISDTLIISNSATANGGGIYFSGSDNTIINSHIEANTANNGGGVDGQVTIMQSTIISNSATNNGGGLRSSSAQVYSSTIAFNSADDGGGIYNSGTLTINDSTLNDNSAGGGGGIASESGLLTVNNSTVSNNSTDGVGGGIVNGGTATINNSTLNGNSADLDGGGIYNFGGTLEMSNSIIANSGAGGDCVNNSGSFNINVNNLIEDGTCNPALSGDPLLGSLQNNGGATETHALLPFSPALEAGDNATCLATDQRGVARPQGAACDIGAYEAEPPICTDTLYPVSDTSELNDAIFCFNAATVAGTYEISFTADITLTMASTTINNATADIDLLMAGNGFALDGNDSVRGLTIAADTHVAIENLTVRNGNQSNGGGIRNSGTLTISNSTVSGNSADNSGGGISNIGGTLTISNSTVSGNSADNGFGGGILNGGTLTISNSTVSGNSADNGFGGGIFNGGTLTISNSTVSDNRAGNNRGGGITYSQGAITLTHVTLDSNRGGGIVEFDPLTNAMFTLQNSIVSNSLNGAGTASAANCVDTNSPNITADSSNMATDATCDGATVVADVLLGPLQDNGGATETHALLPFSPALEAGDNATCLATDQRGVARPQGAACDIGAYEAEPPICTDNPANVSTEGELNDAITCFNGATVAGTYTISFTDNISLTAATTTIDNATAGIDLLIAGNGFALDGQNDERGFTIAVDTNVTVDQLTIQHGSAGNGGAIDNLGQLTVVNSRLISNTFNRRGGAIHNLGTLTVSSSVLSNNGATSGPAGLFGGAIYSTNRTVVVDSLIENNRISDSSGQTFGGGISVRGGTLEVVSSTIRENSAQFSGGGIEAGSGAVVTITQSTIHSNTISRQFGGGVSGFDATITISATDIVSNSAQTQGGGIYVNDGPLTLVNSTVAHNTARLGGGLYFNDEVDGHPLVIRGTTVNANVATSDGGGLAISSVGTMQIANSTISGNDAQRGGGIRTGTGTLVLNNVTVTANEADANGDNLGDGGGIYDPISAQIVLSNTIVAGNLVGGNATSDADCSGPGFVSDGNNLLGDGTGCPVVASDVTANDPLLGLLQDNGGSTETHALLPNSPARDAGDNATCLASDQRGVARPQDGNGDSVATCDIGAYEADVIATIVYNISDASVVEGDSGTVDLTFTITRTSSPIAGSVVVSTTNGSAENGSDYVGITATVNFAIGVTSQMVTVTVNGDSDVEADEALTATLSDVINGVIDDGTGIGIIINDDDFAPSVVDHRPISDAVDVPLSATVVVTFSEPVTVSNAVTLNCDGIDQFVTQTMPSAATLELSPNQPLPPGELCIVTIPADAVEDDDTIDPPDNMAATYVFSFTTSIADSPANNGLRIEAFTYQADPTDNVPNGNLDGFIMLKNVSGAPLNVQGFMVGDEETAGGDEGMFVLPDHTLAVNETLIIAEDADLYAFGGTPDYSFADNSVGVPVLQPATRWSNGAVNLDDSSDEVILLNNDFLLEDGACWGVEDAECVVDNSASRAQYRLLDDGRLADNPSLAGYQRVAAQDTNLQADWLPDQTAVTLRTTQVSVVGIGRSLIITLTIGLLWLTHRTVISAVRTE